MQDRVPVDQPLVLVDQPFLVEGDEHLADGVGQTFVHGEAFAGPVHRGAEAAHLMGDVAAGFGLPFPDLLDELLAAEIVTGLALGGELALDHHLGGDAGVVGSRLPQRVMVPHPLVADHDVLEREVEGVAHVQAAGDVRTAESRWCRETRSNPACRQTNRIFPTLRKFLLRPRSAGRSCRASLADPLSFIKSLRLDRPGTRRGRRTAAYRGAGLGGGQSSSRSARFTMRSISFLTRRSIR